MTFGLSNYPPGVTGNEPQIAGYEHHLDCPSHEDNDPAENANCLCEEIEEAMREDAAEAWYQRQKERGA